VTEAPTAGPPDHSRIANHVLAPSPGIYAIDPVHTFVGFTAQHLVVGRVRGRSERVAGTATVAEELTASSFGGHRGDRQHQHPVRRSGRGPALG
jgi:hypothetical protein